MKLQDNIILFFAHIGRIRDNISDAADCLLNVNIKDLEERFAEFYHQRHIPVHGKILPLVYKQNGVTEMPVLSKNPNDRGGWYHKINNWPDIFNFPRQSITTATNKLFWELLPIVNDIFGGFENIISKELEKNRFKLKFEYSDGYSGFSGYKSEEEIDVYGIKQIIKGYDSSSFD